MNGPLVNLQDVTLKINGKLILDGISFALPPGKIVTLIGPNGAGKSSLARIVLGLQKPTDGQVLQRPGLRLGYVPQNFQIDRTFPLTVKRFLQLAGNGRRWASALERVDMQSFSAAALGELSGGEMQRVLLARTIQIEPDLLVLDEPAQGVDVSGQAEFYRLICEVRDEMGCGALLISHDLHLVMAATDEVLCLNKHVCCAGHPEQVSNDPSFTNLFGRQAAQTLAVYHHHHADGSVADGSVCTKHDHA